MAVGFKSWSVSASSNGSADANINFAEGQLAPTLNNSSRALMAALAAWRLSIGGGITFGGTSNAYTASNETVGVWSAYAAGDLIALKANHTNTGSATLNVDTLGAKSIVTADGGALVAGDIVSGGIYLLAYDGTNFQVLNTLAGGSYQPLDATLTAFAALSTAADRLVYATGADTFALATFTSFARTILDDADAATVRSTLGLGALATLATVNNSNWSGTALAVSNGGTGATDAGGARTALGLGSLATLGSVNNGNWSGTALAVANGGTGASDAGTARSNLGVTAANIGLGSVENKSSATIRGELTKANVDTALGKTAARVNSGSATNSGLISWGTSDPGSLDEGAIYLKHA